MMLNLKFVTRIAGMGSLIALLGFASAVLTIGTAWAQEEETAGDDTAIDEITVLGSLIKRTERSSHLVQTISIEDIQLQGATNAVNILAALPSNQQVTTSDTTAGFGAGLTNFANLRALGAENTLVLVNDKRVVRSPIRDRSVNLNTIPMSLVESVDVLADGASSIYGTDAVAGVINFRLKDEFEGIQFYLHTLQPEAPGGETNAGAVSAGFGSLSDDGWNVYFGGTWREREVINSLERDFGSNEFQPENGLSQVRVRTFPSNIAQFDPVTGALVTDNLNPFPACDPPGSIPSDLVGQPPGACAADFAAMGWGSIVNPEEQWSIVARGSALLGDDHKVSLEYFYAESEISAAIATTIFGGSQFLVPPSSPFFPGAGSTPAIPGWDPTLSGTIVNMTFTPAGRRTTESLAETDRILGELEGEVAGFDYEVWALHSTSDNDITPIQGALLTQGLVDGFAGANGAPFLNPFGDQTPDGVTFIESLQFRDTLRTTESTLTMVGVTLGRDVFETPAGPIAVAVALEYADEEAKFSFLSSPALSGVVVGRDPENSGDRDRVSVTGEVLIPIVEGLEVNASVRWDDYSDFGSTTNPKVLVSWDTNDYVNLHASYNTGFRAPTLYQLNQPQAVGFQQQLFSDPVLCPGDMVDIAAGGIAIRDCLAQYNVLSGGNPLLLPEESDAWGAGIDVNLLDNTLSFGVDYWSYELEAVIGPISPAAIFGDVSRFDALLIRCNEADPVFAAVSETCSLSTAGNPIAFISQLLQNLGTTETSGVDVTVDWKTDTDLGELAVGYRGTFVNDYDFQRLPGDPFLSRAGAYLDGFPVLEYSHYLTLSWQNGPWAAQLQNRYRDGYTDCNTQCRVAAGFENEVDSYSLFDLTATYKFREALAVTIHIDNLADEDPPYSNASGAENCASCDSRLVNVVGRAYGLTIRGTFGDLF